MYFLWALGIAPGGGVGPDLKPNEMPAYRDI
jgi:hypothetical protein